MALSKFSLKYENGLDMTPLLSAIFRNMGKHRRGNQMGENMYRERGGKQDLSWESKSNRSFFVS